MNLNTDTNNWTEEIKSNDSLFSVNLKEVWQYRDLLFMLVKKEFITFYKQTILGPIWFFIQPVLTVLMYVVLFGQIAKLSTDGLPQVAFYLAGTIIWNYFSESLMKTSTIFKDNATVFGKIYVSVGIIVSASLEQNVDEIANNNINPNNLNFFISFF